MINNKRKELLQKITVALTAVFCVASFSSLPFLKSKAEEEETYFDLLEGAIFDDDASKRLTYDTSTRTGVVNAATTSWINRNFSYVEYENVMTVDGEKPFNECTTEFSVTYSDISVLGSQTNILGVQLTSGEYSLAYRVQGKQQYGYSSWLALGNNLDSPFANETQQGNYRIGKELLASTTTITIRVTPKIGDVDGSITCYVNGTEMGTLVYESTEQLTFGLVASQNTAKISDASYKVFGATGWVKPPAPPSYNVFNGEQANAPFGYQVATNTGSLQATSTDFSKPFGNLPEYKSVTLIDGTKTTADQVIWEYEATFTNFNYVNGKDKEVPENYYGTGLALILSDGVALNMRIMYDGRLNIAATNAAVFGLGGYGKNFNIYNFAPSTNATDVQKEITLKYRVDRANNTISYYVNDVEFGTLTYIGKAAINGFGLHSYCGGGTYKNFSLKMMDVASVELPPIYEVFNGEESNETFHYNAEDHTAYLVADSKNYTKAFGNVPTFKSLTLSDGTTAKSSEVVWEYEATISNFSFGNEPLAYYGVGISLMTSDKASLDMRVMYDGRLYICAVPAASASDFGLASSGKIVDIPNFNPSANPEDSQKEITLKFKINRATGEIGYYVDGSLYGSLTYYGEAELNRYALHSWWGGGDYKDISLRVLDVAAVEVRDYYTEEYVPTNPQDAPASQPNLDVKPNSDITYKRACIGAVPTSSICGLLLIGNGMIYLKNRKKKGDN